MTERKPAPADRSHAFETRAVHAGAGPDPTTGARNVPIYQTTSYVFDDVDHAASLFNLQDFGYVYTRLGNPTVSALEERVASLEGGRGAVAAASGHAAQLLAFFSLMEPGDEFIASRSLYGGSITQFMHSFRRFGWKVNFVDPADPDAFRAAINARTKAIFIEVLANPGGILVDIEPIAAIAREAGVLLMVDNTMASPWLFRPFEWGADIVIHSTTKFLSGHGTSMGGVVIESGRFDWNRSAERYPGLTKPDPADHGLTFAETFGDFGYTMKTRAVALRDLG
ncbi:MAG: aminotransferase class I/II-fold pyridoxal phosphate-dependent enzyme, partial [Alphaproteobacteria bacterium]